jgi:hypothetical protein
MGFQHYLSAILTVFFSVILIVFPFVSVIYMKANAKTLLDLQVNNREKYLEKDKKFGSFWERLDLRKPVAAYYNFMFVARRLSLGLILVFMKDYLGL